MHREDREFSVNLHLSAEFGPDYEGEDDGFAWFERFERELKPRLVSAIFEVLRHAPGWEAIAAPRGRDPELGLDIAVRRRIPGAP